MPEQNDPLVPGEVDSDQQQAGVSPDPDVPPTPPVQGDQPVTDPATEPEVNPGGVVQSDHL